MRNPASLKHAQTMHKELTEPEKKLWHQLRASRFQNIKFRRQKVIGRYIADFAANDPKLVIELDGDSHAQSQTYDDKRTLFLESEGYSVVRIANNEVMGNMDGVLVLLSEIIREMACQPPLPTLSPEGERAL